MPVVVDQVCSMVFGEAVRVPESLNELKSVMTAAWAETQAIMDSAVALGMRSRFLIFIGFGFFLFQARRGFEQIEQRNNSAKVEGVNQFFHFFLEGHSKYADSEKPRFKRSIFPASRELQGFFVGIRVKYLSNH
jgi:hypothetical protein